ncbi:SUMF1/EgtB/PvdO family nonheme iron enzyme [Gemmatimonadota bacterium]
MKHIAVFVAILACVTLSAVIAQQYREDFNRDCAVDIADIIALMIYQRDNPGDLKGDYNKDGNANIIDAIAMIQAIVNGNLTPVEEALPSPDDTTVVHGITLVSIPGGTFQMGSTTGHSNEQPVHCVSVSAFQMSIKEITNSQYAEYLNTAFAAGEITVSFNEVTGFDGEYSGGLFIELSGSSDSDNQCGISYDDSSFNVASGKENWPVVEVTWQGAKAFAFKYGFDLPTEAQWEYACRGGQQFEYGTDDGTINSTKANYKWNLRYPTDVGSYPKNPYGLYDMCGNVWEWCNDWFGSYSSENATDPKGPASGSGRILRGGSWYNVAYNCLSAYRNNYAPRGRGGTIGFRVARREFNLPEGLTMVDIPGGTFQMGSNEASNEQPVHQVTVSAFQMSSKEITNSQYAEYLNTAFAAGEISATDSSVTGAAGFNIGQMYLELSASSDSNNQCWISFDGMSFSVASGKDNWPVVFVTWYGAKAFALNYGFDLPTEAQWEYACRGGQQFEYGTDDGTISSTKANYDGNVLHPTDVGSYPKNPYGLYDMCGNVAEWCNDRYGSYSSENVADPQGPRTGLDRVLRISCWPLPDVLCRSATRLMSDPKDRRTYLGFRVVRR